MTNRWWRWVGWGPVLTTVFFWPNATINSFYHPKAAIGLLWALALLSTPTPNGPEMRNPWVRRVCWWVLIQFGVLYVLSGATQTNLFGVPFGPWTIFPTLVFLTSIWLAEKLVRSAEGESRFISVANALCLSGLFVVAVGWSQVFGVDQFIRVQTEHTALGVGRAPSLFGNTMLSMGYAGIIAPLYLVFGSLCYRVAYVATIGLLVVSGAAMGLVAAGLGSLVVLLLTRQWVWAGVMGLVGAGVATWKYAMNDAFFSITNRPIIWQYVIDAWKPVGWTGLGLGAVGHRFGQTKLSGLAMGFEHAHNDFLQGLAELGVVGVFLMVALVLWTLWRTFKTPLSVLQAGWLGVWAALAVNMAFSFPLAIYPCALAGVLAWAGLEWSIAQEARHVSA